MLESIFIILHHLTTLLFGIFLSASFLGMKRNIKNGGILSVFSIVVSAVYTNTVFWVPTACIGTLIGYVLCFLPVLLSKSKATRFKFLISFVLAFALTVILLLVVNIWQPFMITSAIKMACYGFIPAIICVAICIFHFDAFLKAGICTLVGTLPLYFSGYVVDSLFNLEGNNYQINFHNWSECVNGNVMLIILLSLLLLTAVFTGIGLFRIIKRR